MAFDPILDTLKFRDGTSAVTSSPPRMASGTLASRPAAATALKGQLYEATDVGHGMTFLCDGSAWLVFEPAEIASVAAAGVSVTGTTETALMSCTIPVNTLTAGTIIHTTCVGSIDHRNVADTFSFGPRIAGAGALVVATADATARTNRDWHFESWQMIRTVGAGGTFGGHGKITHNIAVGTNVCAVEMQANPAGTTAVDTTAIITLALTITISNASASNICRAMAGSIEIVKRP